MFDINEVDRIERERKQRLKNLYLEIFETFQRRIRFLVEAGREKSVFLRVPAFVAGFPMFDRARASIWLTRQLKHAGFDVQRVTDIDIFCSWAKKRKKTKKKESTPAPDDDSLAFPDLMNLKKLANRYRKSA